jgi:hypothetical protein
MNTRACVLAAVALAVPARAGMPSYPTDQELLAAEGAIVAAVVVEDVRPLVGTNGRPPRLRLRVDEVIRGTLPLKQFEADWPRPEYHGAHEGDRPHAGWLDQPLPAPTHGTRLILLLSREGHAYRIAERCRYPDTAAVRRQVRKAIADYLAFEKRFRIESAREEAAARARLDAMRTSWRAEATPEAIARSALAADFVGIGHLSSGPNDDLATFEITRILKGARRKEYLDSYYFADVRLPKVALEVLDRTLRRPQFVFFLSENGMDLRRAPAYPSVGIGLVLADEEALRVVREALASAPRPRAREMCLLEVSGQVASLAHDENSALRARIEKAFVDGAKRCAIGLGSGLWTYTEPDHVGDAIRKSFPGVGRALRVSIDRTGTATVSGLRIRSDRTEVAFSGEPWPANPADERAAARRLVARLTAR